MKIIDPHLHLFDLTQGDYHWLKEDNPPFWPDKHLIKKSFKETDLTLKPPFTLNHFIHIEAGFDNQQPWRELITLQQNCKTPFRAIAAIDLTLSSQSFNKCLEKLIKLDSFIGVRHLLDEQALSLLTSEQVLTNFTKLNDTAKEKSRQLIFETQLPLSGNASVDNLCHLVNNCKSITFIINHAGFPPADINSNEWLHWQNNLLKLAAYSHVAIKCSGWEMIERQYTQEWLTYNLTTISEAFGLDRMMMASNFPLCLFSHDSYQSYWHSVTENRFFQALSAQEKSALCYDNALRWYAINC